MDITKYIKEAHQTATKHGFHDSTKSDIYWLMLIITEICEVISADREKRQHRRNGVFQRTGTCTPGLYGAI